MYERGQKPLTKQQLYKLRVSFPDISYHDRMMICTTGDREKYLPKAKYIYIAKTQELAKLYKIRGIPVRSKAYGIGVLTDKNKYYFSEVHTRISTLSWILVDEFSSILLRSYVITKDTRVLVGDNINQVKDPLYNFVRIFTSAIGCQLKQQNVFQMLKFINYMYHYVKTTKKQKWTISRWHCKKMIKRLVEMQRFEFITDPMWYDKLDLKVSYMKTAFMECAIGILYMYNRDRDMLYKKHRAERNLRKKIEKIEIKS